MHNNLFLVQYK